MRLYEIEQRIPVSTQYNQDRGNLDWIVLNNPNEAGAGFGTGTNRVTLISKDGTTVDLPKMSKDEVSEAILEHLELP